MPDLGSLFRFDVDPQEIILRGTLIYWFLFALFRLVLRRDVGSLGIADVLLLVLIADASQNAMAGGYESVAEGMVLVSTIAGWNWFVDWISFRYPALRRWLQPPPLKLVEHGRLQRRAMRRELVTTDELMSKLREQGIRDLGEVELAYMESDGEISVIRQRGADDGPPARPQRSTLP
jgi:uncharacterized membrane protein YcaP (DUF421 family)